jgi:hypothetical protein
LIAAAAVLASALLVLDGRWTLAGLALGFAVATKAWAILVAVPLLLMVAPPARRRFAAACVLLMLAAYAPLALGDTHRFRSVVQAAGSLGSHYGEASPPNAWFFTTSVGHFAWPSEVRDGQIVYSDATGFRISNGTAHRAHALVLVLALVLTLAWWRSGNGARRPETLLLLMAAILLLRCVLDPGNHLYYHGAAATSLLAYEALRPRARFPWMAGWFIGGLWVITRVNDHLSTDRAFAWVYLAWAMPTLAGLALIACRRSRSIPPTRPSLISRMRVTASSRA